jgi:hypothetical protein
MDADVVAWAAGGYLFCFAVGLGIGFVHRAVIRLAEAVT